jgi:hypothetical protein
VGLFQFNRSGVFGAVTGAEADTSGNVKQLGNFCYAIGNQSPIGSGNNGIANCAAIGKTVFADPSYATIEVYSFNNPANHVMAPSQSQLWDFRGANFAEYSHNPAASLFINSLYHIPFQQVVQNDLTQNAPTGSGSISVVNRAFEQDLYYSAPGLDLGAPSFGPSGWHQLGGIISNQTINSPSLNVGIAAGVTKAGIGDVQIAEVSGSNYGGAIAPADEGQHAIRSVTGSATTQYAGTVATGSTSATTVTVNCTADCGNPGDGRYLILKGAPVLSNANVKTATAASSGTPGTYTIDQTVTPSTAWATLNGNCSPAISAPVGIAGTSITCNVTMLSGTFATGGGDLICFGGTPTSSWNYHEQAVTTSATATSFTAVLRHQHASTSWVMANGPCGTYVDPTANDVNSLNFPYEIIGATDASTLIWTWFGPNNSIPGATGSGQFQVQTYPAVSLSNTGGIVTFSIAGGTVPIHPELWNGGSVTFTGAAVSAYNGTCTNTFHDPFSVTVIRCSQASSIGAGASATATVAYGTTGYGQSTFNLYSGAEVLDVTTPGSGTAPASVSPGNVTTFTLEPNNAAWASPQAVIEPQHYNWHGTQFAANYNISNPSSWSSGSLSLSFQGAGITSAFQPISVTNLQANNTYMGHGGLSKPPGAIILGGASGTGLFSSFINATWAPDPSASSAFSIGCPVSGCGDLFFNYNLFSLSNFSGTPALITYRPGLNELTLGSNLIFSNPFAKTTFNDNTLASAMATPATPVSVTTQTTGGTFSAGVTPCYTIVAQNSAGTTIQSTEKCGTVTTGTTSSVKVVWSRQQGAITYRVCGRATGAEGLVYTVPSPNVDIVSWIDDGKAVVGTACSTLYTTNSTLPGQDQWAYMGLNSSGTAFQAKLTAPAGAAATYILTLPATAAAGNLVDEPSGATVAGDITIYNNATGQVHDSGILLSSLSGGLSNIQITTGTASIPAGGCSVYTATPMTGLLATSSIIPPTPTSNTSAIAGWAPGAGLNFQYYVTAGTFNWAECNGSGSALAAGANVTWNVGAR